MLLISEPYIDDDYFDKSVIFMCEHNEEGSFGFVLNHYIESTLDELVDDVKAKFKISLGGPVETQNLYFLHSRPDLISNENEVLDGIYLGGDFETVKNLINENKISDKEVKFFLGYAGWSDNQLEKELSEHAWLITDYDRNYILNNSSETLWKEILEDLGGNYELISKYPDNPTEN